MAVKQHNGAAIDKFRNATLTQLRAEVEKATSLRVCPSIIQPDTGDTISRGTGQITVKVRSNRPDDPFSVHEVLITDHAFNVVVAAVPIINWPIVGGKKTGTVTISPPATDGYYLIVCKLDFDDILAPTQHVDMIAIEVVA
jgi:hypothetical protein